MVDRAVTKRAQPNYLSQLQPTHISVDEISLSVVEQPTWLQDFEIGTAVYTGNCQENLPHGKGELKLDGQVYKGEWNEGRLDNIESLNKRVAKQAEQSQMKTVSILVNETRVYIGEVSGDEPHGQGKLVARTGSTFEGKFKDGKLYDGEAKCLDRDGEQ